jgi:hypothetical protein
MLSHRKFGRVHVVVDRAAGDETLTDIARSYNVSHSTMA